MLSLRVRTQLVLFVMAALPVRAQDFLSARIISPSQLPDSVAVVAVGDLNGDGISDVVYSTASSFGVAFGSKSGFISGGTYPQALRIGQVADINGDGKPDLVAAVGGGPTALLLIYLNQGDGTFTGPMTTAITTDTNLWPVPMSVVVGDFDSDGKPDVIVTTSDGANFFFFHGNGDGTVAPPRLFTGRYSNGYQVKDAVDLNGDGKLDLVVYVITGAMVEILLGNGDGTFQAEEAIPGTYNYSPVVADLNGDGVLDIATTGIQSTTSPSPVATIYAGNGDGTFRQINTFAYSSVFGSLLGARDVNGDGSLDLIFDDPNGFTVCLGLGGGQFGPPVTYAVPRWGSAGSAIGDFNGDGLLDLITAFNSSAVGTANLVYLLKGFPGGAFEGGEVADVGSQPLTMASSDLNHDGIPDVVASTRSGTFVYLSRSDGSYSSTLDSTPLGDQIFLADLDGDGNADALYVPSFSGSNVSFRHGNGDGTFASPVAGMALTTGALNVILADLDGDGKPDLVGIVDTALDVWLGQGGGNFGTPASYNPPAGSAAYAGKIVVADVNGDGINDVVAIASSNVNNVTVLLGTGTGGKLSTPQGSYPASDFVLADVNADGKLDLVTLSPDASKVGIDIYLGDGTGSFGAPTFLPTSQPYTAITSADFNLDGNPDLLLTGNESVAVLHGDGKGGFGSEEVLVTGDGPQDALVGDWNNDGAPDIAIANWILGSPSPQSIEFLLNRSGSKALLSASSNPAQYGQSISLDASIVPTVLGSATPAGTVSLLEGGQAFSGPLTNGTYSAPLGTLAVGNYAISGTYLGDGNYLPKSFPSSTLTITTANTTTSISPSANPGTFGTTVNFNIVVHPAFSGVPTGSVSLFDGANLLGTATLDQAGSANFALNSLSQGNHILSAQYAGDVDFVPSTSANLTEAVLYPTTVSITSSASSVLIGSTVTLTANVASQSGTPTGNVVFLDGSTALGQVAVSSGTATFSLSTLSQGIHNLQAAYQGDGTFMLGTSAILTETITDFSVAATSTSLTLNAGASGTYTVNVTPLSGFSGSVEFTCSGAPQLATCTVTPTSVQVSGSTAQVTVQVTTTGPNQAGMQHRRQLWILASLSPAVFGFIGLLGRLSKTKGWSTLTFFALLLLCGMSGCGGSNSSVSQPPPRTPAGKSSLVFTATASESGVTVQHGLFLSLTVN